MMPDGPKTDQKGQTMARKEYFPNVRRTERREEQVRYIAEATGLDEDFSSVIDFALSVAVALVRTGQLQTPAEEPKRPADS